MLLLLERISNDFSSRDLRITHLPNQSTDLGFSLSSVRCREMLCHRLPNLCGGLATQVNTRNSFIDQKTHLPESLDAEEQIFKIM